MAKLRACDVCSLRKIRCNGLQPCPACIKAGFECSFTKKPMKPGPKGPRATTCTRIKKEVQEIKKGTRSIPRSIKSDVVLESVHDAENGAPSSPSSVSQHSNIVDFPLPLLEPSLPTTNTPLTSWSSSITLTDVLAYLEIYHYKMYPVWPVVDRVPLTAKLQANLNDPETCALAFSVCAATGAQLRLDAECSKARPGAIFPGYDQAAMSDRFAAEAERNRSQYDYRERSTTEGILIPLFLHFYYCIKKKNLTSTLLLKEAVTMCQLLRLDKEFLYPVFPIAEQRYRRKIFWLLFVTERGHAMQNDTSISLTNSIDLPTIEEDNEPQLFGAFLGLVRLFVTVDGILTTVKDKSGRRTSTYSKEMLSHLQKQLREDPRLPSQSNELQKTDICITQQWMRMLVWQLSMKNIYLSTNSGDESMSLTYPAKIAKDSLFFLSKVSLDSLVAHGPGMELKLFEIANTLLDVINFVPLMSQDLSLRTQTPRDVLHSLCCILSQIGGNNANSLTILQSKIAESKIPFRPIPRLMEMKDEIPASPPSNDRNSAVSTTDCEYLGSVSPSAGPEQIDAWTQAGPATKQRSPTPLNAAPASTGWSDDEQYEPNPILPPPLMPIPGKFFDEGQILWDTF